ncbi:hypothetical protein L7F22_058729 [Adiantum nelumboides]|nr:hypothetical protein [Adiantum nelumboides]
MAEDSAHSCCYCNSEHTQLEFALHKISNAHVKKVQRGLFQRGFSSVCLVCNFALKDLKHMELHVQERKHTERMMLMKNFLCSDKRTCGSCGVTFHNEVVFEAHRLLRVHDFEESPPNTPKLNDLYKELSGTCGTRFLSNCFHPCNVCNVTVNGVQESIMHLFSPSHVTRLRSSSCIVCKKDFMHASDRECHLKSGKHTLAMCKCRDFLEEVDTQSLLQKGGYPCMFCMIWCNSWLCLELHILDTYHNKVLTQRKANYPSSSRIIFLAGSEGSGEASRCNESAMSGWEEWKGKALDEYIWCHRCGVTLLGIDEANQHLNTHGTESCQARREFHKINTLGLAQLPKLYDCSVCAMSFKSALMLSAHTACLEHHRRLVAFSLPSNVFCCSSCGLLIKNDRDGDGVFVCKKINCSSLPEKDTEAIVRSSKSPSTRSCVMEDVSSIGITRFSSGSHQNPALLVASENIIDCNGVNSHHATANGFLKADGSNQDHSIPSLSDLSMLPVESGPRMNQINAGVIVNGSSNDVASNSGVGCLKNSGLYASADAVINGNSRLAAQIGKNVVAAKSNFEPCKDNLLLDACRDVNTPQAESRLPLQLTGFESKVLVPGQMSEEKGAILVKNACLEDLSVPVIVAATLVPLKDLQQSLQSITAIVTETLSSALPDLYAQQSTSYLKRKMQDAFDKTADEVQSKKLCEERALKAALQQGLRSVSSHGTKLEDMVRQHSSGDDESKQELRAVLAMAASVIPSDLPNQYRHTSEQDQAVDTKGVASNSGAMGRDLDLHRKDKCVDQAVDTKGVASNLGAMGRDLDLHRKDKCVVLETSTQRREHLTTSISDTREETRAQAETAHLQQLPAFPDTENYVQSLALSPFTKDSKKVEGAPQLRKPVVPFVVKAPSHNSNSESNDDDDDEEDYSFLDPTKCQGKWWGLSDSDDSDSI